MGDKNKLTYKQEKFIQEYMVDLNATQAAIRAGYSKKTARQIAEQTLSKIDVKRRLDELRSKNRDESSINAAKLQKMIEAISTADFTEYLIVDDLKEIPKEIAPLVKSARIKPDGIEVIFMDKDKALENLGKILGAFTEKREINVTSDLGAAIIEARQRSS